MRAALRQVLFGSRSLLSQVLALSPNALYDPSDLTSLYQSRTGGSTGAVDAVAGIMLDKRWMNGLSAASYIAGRANLVTNGGFDSDTAWTKDTGWTIAGGKASFNHTAAGRIRQDSVLTVGQWYEVTFTVSDFVAGYVALLTLTPNFTAANANGTYKVIGYANNTQFNPFCPADANLSIDNVSIRSIPGNHALPPSDAARPIRRSPAKIDFDGVDDVLNAQIAANLGADCSVYHYTAAGSHVWLDDQTINAGSYALPTTDWVVALILSTTPSDAEKALVQRWAESVAVKA